MWWIMPKLGQMDHPGDAARSLFRAWGLALDFPDHPVPKGENPAMNFGSKMSEAFIACIAAIFTQNILLAYFLDLCPVDRNGHRTLFPLFVSIAGRFSPPDYRELRHPGCLSFYGHPRL